MSYTYRPESFNERLSILSAVIAFRAEANASPVALAIEQACFAPEASTWKAAADHHLNLRSAARTASKNTDDARDLFKAALRRWWKTVNDDEGLGMASDLAALLGGTTPGQILRKKPREQVTLARRLVAMVESRPDLKGDPAPWAALCVALGDFEVKVNADEAAFRAQVSQGSVLNAASPAFDAAYGLLVRNFLKILGASEAWRILPRFLRSDDTGQSARDDRSAPTAPGVGPDDAAVVESIPEG